MYRFDEFRTGRMHPKGKETVEDRLWIRLACPNAECTGYRVPITTFFNRAELREMSREENADKIFCSICGQGRKLSSVEKDDIRILLAATTEQV